jgi:hypothetical protein
MKAMHLLAPAAVTVAMMACGAAQANTYDFGTLSVDGHTLTSDTINDGPGVSTDTFTFKTIDALTEFTTGAFTEKTPFEITQVDFTLYNAADEMLATSGSFDPSAGPTPTISANLDPGDYHVVATITVPDEAIGSYTLAVTAVSAAPEAATWMLTIAGVGLAGAALRQRRRTATSVA